MRMGINSAGKCLRTLEPKLGVTPHPPSYLGHPLPKGEGCYFALSPASSGRSTRGQQPYPYDFGGANWEAYCLHNSSLSLQTVSK